MEGLIEGRIVHYVMPNGEHRPAIVVNVWDVTGVCDGYINLQVFTDFGNDAMNVPSNEPETKAQVNAGRLWATSVCFDDDEKLPGTWHWVEKA